MQTWILLAITYPFLYAFVNVIDKFLLEKKIKNFYSYSIITGMVWLASSIITWAIVGMPKLGPKVIFIGILAGVAYGIIFLMYFHLLTYAEVSRVIGMGYLYAAFVAVYARIFLGEMLSAIKYGAIALAILGTILLGMQRIKQKWRLGHLFWFMILYAIILAIVDVSDKYLLGYLTYWQTYAFFTLPLSIVLMLPAFSKKARKDLPNTMRNWVAILIVQILGIVGTFIFLKAASLAPIAIVSGLGTLQPMFVFLIMLLLSLFTPKLLKEVITPGAIAYKILGIAGVVIGAIILSL